MATTTNYGWDTPDDTDLVKDGAAAIRTLGSSIDTTTKNLNPETTLGDLAYRSATANVKTRLALGTAGQVLRVNSGGNAPEWATTADQTPLTTKGDVFTFSTVDDRLGVGANGTVLTADSAEATGLKWAAPSAGALTLTGTSDFTTSAAISINNCFSATYLNYVILMNLTAASANTGFNLKLRASGTDASSNYNMNRLYISGATATAAESLSAASIDIGEVATSYPTIMSFEAFLFAPFATQATSGFSRCRFANTNNNRFFEVRGYDHTTAGSYDGFSIIPGSGTLTGKIRVYGYALS